VLKIMVVFSMVSVFWALFDQHASTWIDQARQMGLGLRVPAYLGYWAFAATIGLSLFAGVWLFRWLANDPISRGATKGVLALTAVAGLAAGGLDLVGPPRGTITSLPGEPVVRGRMLDIELDAAQISALNPLFVMIIIPALNFLVYNPLRARGIEIKPLQKMTLGMFLTAAAFAAAAFLQVAIEAAGPGNVHVLWQVIQYFIMTVAEVLISITGLEFAYTQAPRAMKSTIMSFWLLCVTFGNLLVAFLAPLQETLALSQFFWLFAGLMAGAAVIFAILASFYSGKSYLQEAAHP
jgi:dipeptide/tripeptide permease